jgi:hypothetical protein
VTGNPADRYKFRSSPLRNQMRRAWPKIFATASGRSSRSSHGWTRCCRRPST